MFQRNASWVDRDECVTGRSVGTPCASLAAAAAKAELVVNMIYLIVIRVPAEHLVCRYDPVISPAFRRNASC